MSLTTGLVTFPDQRAIINHINHSAYKTLIHSKSFQDAFSDGIEKVATQFANKTMKYEEINKNVETAFTDENEESEALDDLTDALWKLVLVWKGVEKKRGFTNPDTMNMEFLTQHVELLSESKKSQKDIIITTYKKILSDLVVNATYTPPPASPNVPGSWTRHVQNLT